MLSNFQHFALTGNQFNDIDDQTRMNAGEYRLLPPVPICQHRPESKLFEARFSHS
jgi:hypothetical protein